MKLFIELDIEKGEVKSAKVVRAKKVIEGTTFSEYARYFDEGCTGWQKDADCNKLFLKQQEIYATDLLKERGHLYLNEVYDMLGIPRSRAGQIVGWIYDDENPYADNRVDFGLALEMNREFINGWNNRPMLDFNVDGNILELVEEWG